MGLRAKASAFAHPRAPHLAALRSRPFTAAVEILIPSTTDDDGAPRPRADASSALDALDADGGGVPDFYIARMTIEELLSRDFVEAHARGRSASLSAVCVDARIDAEDVACVTPCGRAHFSLTPSSHARLGVTGERRDRGTAKHHAVVNLRRKDYEPGSPFHDRLRANAAAMTAADGAEASKRAYLCAHSVDGEPARMTFPDGVDARPGVLAYSSRVAGGAAAAAAAAAAGEPPPPPPSSFYPGSRGVSDGGEDASEDAAAALASFHEYVGAISCGCDVGGDAVEAHRWEGLLGPRRVEAALSFCRDAVTAGAAPWAALTAWGFADDPSAEWAGGKVKGGKGGNAPRSGMRSHRGGGGGWGDDITFVVLPGDGYVMYSNP
jgi:hypothetical protein